jgi:hypothetical protein
LVLLELLDRGARSVLQVVELALQRLNPDTVAVDLAEKAE